MRKILPRSYFIAFCIFTARILKMKYFKHALFFSKYFLALIPTLFCSYNVSAQMPKNGLDVKHYAFYITLNDSTNNIVGKAIISTGFTEKINYVQLDLVKKNKEGKGMLVHSVLKNNIPIKFFQDSQHLVILDNGLPGMVNIYTINYEGIPADGLIISKTKFGQRSFFADNWPNRAHNWIPCNDHLSDKATVEFMVTAPDHYQVVSNGKVIEETSLPGNMKFTHWSESTPLPTKVMVIGVTRFAVQQTGEVDCIPVSSWVYPENRDSGFSHYAIAKNILQWYQTHVGAYGFEKLANVQSKTIFGGMENAGCIFYFENSVNSKGLEALFAHEIAHQWFGDNATETDWPHLWLSEGFATYMTDVFFENKYGKDTLKSMLQTQREEVLSFYKKYKTPVIDTTSKNNLMHLLNANSYQKGAWVLHMLRNKLGDSIFWKSIRLYYKTYAGSNASTKDLQKIFEQAAHQNLATFFHQWLYIPGQPELKIQWSYHSKVKKVFVHIEQMQQDLFDFSLQISLVNGNKKLMKTISIKNKITEISLPLSFIPNEIKIDPGVNLLFDLIALEKTIH